MIQYGGIASKRDFSEGKRKAMAKEGTAMPNGSYPIANGEDLSNAIGLVGNSKDYSKEKVQAHIVARAKELGLEDKLPDSWGVKKRAKPLGALVSKSSFRLDPFQSDPVNTDTTQEDPSVDSLKNPVSYTDVIGQRARALPGASLQTPRRFGQMQASPMNANAILTALTVANS